MECRDRLEDYLRENGVPFEVQHHPRVITAQEVAATEHVPGKMLAKVVMILADGEMIMLALPAPYEVDLQNVGEDETIFFRAGTHTDTISVRYADFDQLVQPTVAEFARRD